MQRILGIDEVGRGPWAGPLVVGAVILGEEPNNIDSSLSRTRDPSKLAPDEQRQYLWQNLADSKKLSATKRGKLNDLVLQHASATGLSYATSAEIDRYGLSPALKLATRRAVKQILKQKVPFTEIIIDGTINLLDTTPLADRVTLLKKADNLVKEVSAASIIAKVSRDRYMIELADKHPGYGFEKHVGYGTSEHSQALANLGPCPEHRRSFRPVREAISRAEVGSKTEKGTNETPSLSIHTLGRNNSKLGHAAERAVAAHLTHLGHEIIVQNFKTKICEIDLVSIFQNEIIFTEVKYHQTSAYGSPLEQIDAKKLRQIHRAAEIFLMLHPEYQKLQPRLAAASVSGYNYHIDDYFMID